MKRVLLSLGIGITVLSVTAGAQLAGPHKALVDAERAFAAVATEKGQREAFLAYLADDSLLFRPGPVPGKMFYRTRPVPPGLLTWGPDFSDVSIAGDYGLNAGPFEFRKDGKTTDPVTGYGHFVSIWKKQRDGSWKVEVDLGVSHDKFPKAVADLKDADVTTLKPLAPPPAIKPAPAAPAPAASAAAPKPGDAKAGSPKAGEAKAGDAKAADAKAADAKAGAATAGAATAGAAAKPGDVKPAAPNAPVPPPSVTAVQPAAKPADPLIQSLSDADKAFAKAAAEQGLLKAYQAVALDEVRIYRNGQLPTVGKAELEKALGANAASKTLTWDPVHTRASTSGDFGYTTGAYAPASGGANPMASSAQPQRQYYVHVWRRGADGVWKLLLDIIV